MGLAEKNFALHKQAWKKLGKPIPQVLQGDSRRLSEILQEAQIVVTSSPYADIEQSGGTKGLKKYGTGLTQGERCFDNYSTTPGQLGAMPSVRLADVICTSPPYADSLIEGTTGGRMGDGGPRKHWTKTVKTRESQYNKANLSNLGNLKAGSVASVVTSPPFMGQMNQGGAGTTGIIQKIAIQTGRNPDGNSRKTMAQSKQWPETIGQIGNALPATYWQAVADVYRECHKILKPNGIICVVVKAYVKGGKRVPLPMQTLKLLIHLGFTPLERIKAMLVKETRTPSLFGGDIVKRKKRASFFRLLAEKKGSPRIDFEEVLICRKGE